MRVGGRNKLRDHETERRRNYKANCREFRLFLLRLAWRHPPPLCFLLLRLFLACLLFPLSLCCVPMCRRIGSLYCLAAAETTHKKNINNLTTITHTTQQEEWEHTYEGIDRCVGR